MTSFAFFFFQAEDGIRDVAVTGVQTCALPIFSRPGGTPPRVGEAALFGGIALYFLRGGVPPGRLTFAVVACLVALAASRSEERRVGKEGRSRWSPYH